MAPRIKLIEDLNNPPPEVGKVLAAYMERTGGQYAKIALDMDHPWRQKGTDDHHQWALQIANAYGLSPRLLELKLQYDWYLVREGLIAQRSQQLVEMLGTVIAGALQCPY
ncbi:MAG TPA: hypothetical protein VMV15_14990 [Candidatus Binataceae bacterium]|jgi:hypothetical protein|nr:hypothetical protein [Candidatus Binataceae bacterium]